MSNSSRRCSGFTLIEMIIAIVVIAVGLAGVLSAFNVVVRSSSDPLVRKQMLALAEEMMEEVMLKPYAAGPGSIALCDRSGADDISDYNGYHQAVCSVDGVAIPALADYTIDVVVTAAALGAIAAGNASSVTVTVTHGSDTVTLTGWRANYAAGLP